MHNGFFKRAALAFALLTVGFDAGAITISVVPDTQTVNAGDALSVDILISDLAPGSPPPGGAPSLSEFDIDLNFGWCPSVYVMSIVECGEQVFDGFQGIQKRCGYPKAQQLRRGPDMIGHPRRHGRRDRPPFTGRSVASGRFRGGQFLTQAQVGQAEMVVSQRQPHLLFHPRPLLGKRGRLASQPPIVFAPGQVIPLHKARVDRRAGGGCGQSRLKLVRASPDPLTGHLDHPSFFTSLNHLSIQQIRRWAAPWGRISSSRPLALGLIPFPIGMEQGAGIARPLVASKEGDVIVGHIHHALQEQVRLSLRALAHDKPYHQAPFGRKGDPHPSIAIRLAPLLRHRQILVLGMDKAPQFIQLTLGHRQLAPMGQNHQTTLLGGPSQPRTNRILVDLDDSCRTLDGISLRQRPHRQFENGGVGLEVKIRSSVRQGHSPPARTTQRLLFPVTGTIFDQQPLTKGPTVVVTGTIGAVERFPLHKIPGQ